VNTSALKNEVPVDQAALEREAAGIDLGAPPPDPAQPGADAGATAGAAGEGGPELSPEEAAQRAAGAEPLLHGLIELLHTNLAPNWKLDPAKQAALARSASVALVLWFPHEIPPKYVALIGVAAATWAVVQDNKNPLTGELQPRFAPQTAPPGAPDADVRTAS
jgi:hypothetical protein